jgi:hypothetical protein
MSSGDSEESAGYECVCAPLAEKGMTGVMAQVVVLVVVVVVAVDMMEDSECVSKEGPGHLSRAIKGTETLRRTSESSYENLKGGETQLPHNRDRPEAGLIHFAATADILPGSGTSTCVVTV